MKAKVEVIIEQEETATEQLARGVDEAAANTGNAMDELKEDVEEALGDQYDGVEVVRVEKA